MVFLGQASNYSAGQVFRHLFARNGRRHGEAKRQRLRRVLAEHYLPTAADSESSQVQLYHTGRSALTAAFKALAPEGSTIIIPGLTCIAVVRAVRAAGCTPVFVDIDPKTLQYDFDSLDKTINLCYNVNIIVAQNTLGLPLDMQRLEEFAKKHQLKIVEDLAHCAGRFYPDGREIGTVGAATVLSFGKGKAIDTIEGGAVVLRQLSDDIGNQSSQKDEKSSSQPAIHQTLLPEPTKDPRLGDRLRDRWYPVFGALMRGAHYLGLQKIVTGILLKLNWIARSADADLDLNLRLPGWQAGLAERQLDQLIATPPRKPLREPHLVLQRDKLLEKLAKSGYHLSEIWYDTPVSPARYAEEAAFPVTECPRTVQVTKQIINLPTWYSPRKLDRARQIIASFQVDGDIDGPCAENAKDMDKSHTKDAGGSCSEILTPLSSEELQSEELEQAWQKVTQKHPEANFLQSPAWGETNRLIHHRVFLLRKPDVWCLMIVKNAKRGRYLEIPGGPLLDWQDYIAASETFSRIRELAKRENCVFVRFRPQLRQSDMNQALIAPAGARKAPMHLHAEHTVILDLTKPEAELLADMRRQTRYEVRRQAKFGITVEYSNSEAMFREFHQVQTETALRQNFVPPSLETLLAERTAFGDHATIYLARSDQGEPIAYGLVLTSGLEAEYFEAASTDLGRKLPGAYALQWQIIRDLKSQGFERYNLWGIAPLGQEHHRYAGVTTFKTGFGGEIVEFLPAEDIVIKRCRYLLNLAIEKLRKKARHL